MNWLVTTCELLNIKTTFFYSFFKAFDQLLKYTTYCLLQKKNVTHSSLTTISSFFNVKFSWSLLNSASSPSPFEKLLLLSTSSILQCATSAWNEGQSSQIFSSSDLNTSIMLSLESRSWIGLEIWQESHFMKFSASFSSFNRKKDNKFFYRKVNICKTVTKINIK